MPPLVMPGLDPGISEHLDFPTISVDGRAKPGHERRKVPLPFASARQSAEGDAAAGKFAFVEKEPQPRLGG
jgi:hypothetical protein